MHNKKVIKYHILKNDIEQAEDCIADYNILWFHEIFITENKDNFLSEACKDVSLKSIRRRMLACKKKLDAMAIISYEDADNAAPDDSKLEAVNKDTVNKKLH